MRLETESTSASNLANWFVGQIHLCLLRLFAALHVVKVRAKAMQKATEAVDSGMMTVFLAHGHKLNYAMLAARTYCKERLGIEDPVCKVANFLYTECKVIAGHTEVSTAVRVL